MSTVHGSKEQMITYALIDPKSNKCIVFTANKEWAERVALATNLKIEINKKI